MKKTISTICSSFPVIICHKCGHVRTFILSGKGPLYICVLQFEREKHLSYMDRNTTHFYNMYAKEKNIIYVHVHNMYVISNM